MRRNRLLSAAAFAMLAVLAAPKPQEDFDWMSNLDAARAKARKEGRPLLVVFR